ncbi:TonB-linked SusC/RagA family outer membrane protein [Rhabdobacter roseus]|uniref:TonB-linked SusC/RagA family outer membrane protein n=1 Tax=Rhabdobacter roseus TaxID=1655419 RepID=A0A840TRE0_9BACT|nr:TonB-dependent receptor [Rhabdobacter roseus]MBB5283803.1 TonB-linked SusC/RagA family outer membrane protein [Rhabdobacter roseus]
MKKTLTKIGRVLYYVQSAMKYSAFLFAIVCSVTSMSIARDSYGQQLLDTPVSVQFTNATLSEALHHIAQQTRVQFVFVGAEPMEKKTTSLKVNKQSLRTVLPRLLQPFGLSYQVIENRIVIKGPASLPAGEKEESGTLQPIPQEARSQFHVSPELRRPNSPVIQIPSYLPIRITGRVSDEKGGALPGVNIIIQGTPQGTTTDSDGNFQLEVPDERTVLVFSFVGYMSQEVPVGNKTKLEIKLAVDERALEEVVVVGFGERRRKDLTGSVSTVTAEAIEKIGTASPQFALQGNATGVRVINTSGNPNDAPQIFVRGIGTWNGDSQPLYVVDGQILEPPRAGNEDEISGGGLNTPPNLFNLINPNDIESISVLKDASAAAVYGSRAANGVVLITTKKGKRGAPSVEFSTRLGIKNTPTYSMLNTPQFVDLTREMFTNSTNPDVSVERNLYGRQEPNDAVRLTSFSPQFDPESPYFLGNSPTYNWQDALVNRNAPNQTYDVKVSGANDRVDYYISAGLMEQEGLVNRNNFRRYTGAINLNVKVTDWLKVGVNYKYTSQLSTDYGGDILTVATAPPWQPLYDANNRYGYAPVLDPYRFGNAWQGIRIYGQGSKSNALALSDLNHGSFDINRSLGQFYVEVSPLAGLKFRGSLNLDYSKQDRFSLAAFSISNVFRIDGRDPRTESPNAPNSLGRMEHRINNTFNFQSDFTTSYTRTFANKHNLDLTAAVQDQRHSREFVNLSSENLTYLTEDPKNTGYGNDLANNSSIYGRSMRFWFGLVGRASYNYDSKYYLDFSYRRDASNGFDKAYRWGNFYSIAGAWRISNESFFNLPFVDDLKIRGGWGQAGNDQAAVGRYAFLSRVNTGLTSYRWGSGAGNAIGNISLGAMVNDFPNPALSWEVSTTTYLGLDAYLLKNKMNVTLEWYNRVTSGILQTVDLPLSVGTNNPLFNIGEMENKGLDVLVGYSNNIRDFSYNISGNISFVRNRVTKLYQGQPLFIAGLLERNPADIARIEEGRSVGVIWGYKVGGIFQSQDEIDAHFANTPDSNVGNINFVEPGDMYFQDIHGNPTETERFYSKTPDGRINENDRTEIGNTIPGYTYGFNLSLAWKGFDISTSFYGEGDVQKINFERRSMEAMSGGGPNYMATTLDRWTPENRQSGMPRAVFGDPAGNNRISDRWVESAAFFRLNNWQLGYTVPTMALSKINNVVRSLRFYVGGENNLYLFRWTGIDPVNGSFPLPRTFSVGLNVRF